jgi:hypothetical protein
MIHRDPRASIGLTRTEALGDPVVGNDELFSGRHTDGSSGFREDLEELLEFESGQFGNLAFLGSIPSSVEQVLPELLLVEIDPFAVSHSSEDSASHSQSPCVPAHG